MEEEFHPVADKILMELALSFKKDPKLSTFDIIPAVSKENKSPVIREEHSLGLESWCVPHVYCHAYQSLMSLRQTKKKITDLNRLNILLMGALLISPDVPTFWNMRKELILRGKLNPYSELHFCAVVLSRKPKSPEIFSHRKWILSKMLKEGSPECCGVLTKEMLLCGVASDRYSNNYHAWTHRLWCLTQGIPIQSNVLSFLSQELNWSTSWLLKHVSDYSGMHYRQQLLSRIIHHVQTTHDSSSLFSFVDSAFDSFTTACPGSPPKRPESLSLKICVHELVFNSDMIADFAGHEALWYHRRFIFTLFKGLWSVDGDKKSWASDRSTHSNTEGAPLEKNQKLDTTGRVALWLRLYEESFLKRCTTDERTQSYASRHKEWLFKFLQFQIPCSSVLN